MVSYFEGTHPCSNKLPVCCGETSDVVLLDDGLEDWPDAFPDWQGWFRLDDI